MNNYKTIDLYIESQNIKTNIEFYKKKLINDIDKNDDISWLDNPYLDSVTYYKIVDTLDKIETDRFLYLRSKTLVESYPVFDEQYILNCIKENFNFEQYKYESNSRKYSKNSKKKKKKNIYILEEDDSDDSESYDIGNKGFYK
jgi:hypothetical protein